MTDYYETSAKEIVETPEPRQVKVNEMFEGICKHIMEFRKRFMPENDKEFGRRMTMDEKRKMLTRSQAKKAPSSCC